jgi:predicted amidophosphoribosyltransferase
MERCPVCKARLKRDTSICPRCGTDLSIPLSIELQAEHLIYQSITLLNADKLNQAARAAEQSLQLKRDPLALAVLSFIQHQKRVSAELLLL